MKVPKDNLFIKGLSASAISLISASLKESVSHLLITPDKDSAGYLYHDLNQLLGEGTVFFLPSSYKRSPEFGQFENSSHILRTEAIQELGKTKYGQYFITHTEALMEKIPGKSILHDHTLKIKNKEKIDQQFVIDFLKELGFQRSDFVYEPGFYSVRGSILDIFSYSHEEPYRLDFFGNEIESIRSFDIETQLSKQTFEEIIIIPELSYGESDGYVSLPESLSSNIQIWINSPTLVFEKMNEIHKKVGEQYKLKEEKAGYSDIPPAERLINGDQLANDLLNKAFIFWGNYQNIKAGKTLNMNVSPQPLFHKQFKLIEKDILEKQEKGYKIMMLSGNKRQLDRLQQIFIDRGSKIHYDEINLALHEGFVDHDLMLCIYTDHQIFDRYHKYSLKTDKTKAAQQSISIKELTQLNPGDYVVHIDHGIGKFGGLTTVEENGRRQEFIQLIYKDNDILLVNIHSLHRISKYKGGDGEAPKIYKLGTGDWSRLKERTKKKVKDIARDLIALYARRKSEPGYAFQADSYLQKELEASFIYEDTPDQTKTTLMIKQDMEAKNPMDRLVCGDVGFGKTEIAIRASFKAVSDNKQVAILVPTTILAMQHFHTFRDRLKAFPCRVEYISRLRKTSDIRKILKDTQEGKVDILIGTHRLVGKDVFFKDLGLLIIDEEQRFGVAVKEKIKQMKINIDTLALTATPIPRTLQFSLMGARDLSILNTAPSNRHPIQTELHTFNENIIKEAIQFEVERGGQVFFINNRIKNIPEIEIYIKRLLPKINIAIAHGQIDGNNLEKIMLEFINGDHDVLIATTIIESGLDIPNANTIIINNAHQFGLSDLHQLRGRVGRSNQKAFCYLLAPPVSTLTNDARRRLKILEEFSELGSGFQIAMQDLDIRGAGNLLGGEQSGFIANIGYETYHRILEEALLELRETEFSSLNTESPNHQKKFVSDCLIETDANARFPENYISNTSERINLYRELDNLKEEDQIQIFRKNIEDRFGQLPPEAENLLQIASIRFCAEQLGIEKLSYKKNTIQINFISNKDSPFYQSQTFASILQWLQNNPKLAKIEEKNGKLRLTIPKVKTISDIKNILKQIKGNNELKAQNNN